MSKRNSQLTKLILDTPKDKFSFIWPISLIILLLSLTYFFGPDNYAFWLAK
ncbi:hypothetical protein [Pedobacter sp. Leaf170]|uniref:hypothetical protein n=1 Tax=Pedobacter sp. Leaf170 TaxID=2876558 RepID=UPI001E5B4EAC|nr:hypothetical protein [Pedobacter sp. Leaf170]